METATHFSQVSTAYRLEVYLQQIDSTIYGNKWHRIIWFDHSATFYYLPAGTSLNIQRKTMRGWVMQVSDEGMVNFFRHYPMYFNSPLYDPHASSLAVKTTKNIIEQFGQLAALIKRAGPLENLTYLIQPYVDLFLTIAAESYRVNNPQPLNDYGAVMVQKFKTLVNLNFKNRNFSTRQYGLALHLSPSDLNKLCRCRINKNVRDYVETIRISFAKSLLLTSSDPIKEIAYILGYENQGHFSTYFKRHTGLSPDALRKLGNQPKN